MPVCRQISTVWRTESLYLGGITSARVSKAEMMRKPSNWEQIIAYKGVGLLLWWFGEVATANLYTRLKISFPTDFCTSRYLKALHRIKGSTGTLYMLFSNSCTTCWLMQRSSKKDITYSHSTMGQTMSNHYHPRPLQYQSLLLEVTASWAAAYGLTRLQALEAHEHKWSIQAHLLWRNSDGPS